jgi:hypothetical protein
MVNLTPIGSDSVQVDGDFSITRQLFFFKSFRQYLLGCLLLEKHCVIQGKCFIERIVSFIAAGLVAQFSSASRDWRRDNRVL